MMASSSNCYEDLPFEDEEIIEAMTCCFEEKADFLDHESGINLLGILVADEEPGMGGIKATLMSMWKTIGQVRIIRIKKNAYSLSVGSEKLARRLIDDGPWNVKGLCFSVRLWPNHHSFEEIETCRATYWIQAHGIPPELMTKNNGRKLGEMLGSVLEVEDPKEVGNRGYLRLRIDIDTRRPLATFVNLPRSMGKVSKITMQYEGLKKFCFHCGRLGHPESACRYQVSPVLICLGVKYNQNLVAEPPQRPILTQTHFPLEFPYAPTTGIFRRKVDYQGKIVNLNSNATVTADSGAVVRRGDTGMAHNLRSNESQLGKGESSYKLAAVHVPKQKFTSGGPDMLHPDTHGAIFRNGSVTRALGGLNINQRAWVDPEVIPPWAFNNRDELSTNPCFPFPTKMDFVSGPPSTVQLKEIESNELVGNNMGIFIKKTMPSLTQNTKEVIPPHSIEELTTPAKRKRKPRSLYSDETPLKRTKRKGPTLRLSASRGRGRGRGGRGGVRGIGNDIHKKGQSDGGEALTQCNTECTDPFLLKEGERDSTHPHGGGGWPKTAAEEI
ncbi:hypothetical protein ACLB2K_034723 [Fragaria x ananassa]